MNKLLFNLLVFLVVLNTCTPLFGQYEPVVRNDAKWKILSTSPKGGHDLDEYINFEFGSDTIINNVTYKHLIKTKHITIEPDRTINYRNESYGYLREDSSGKVYYLGPRMYPNAGWYLLNPKLDTNEFLLYDFSFQTGDSIEYKWHVDTSKVNMTLITDSVSFVNINGRKRKQIHFSYQNQQYLSWIEGIGDSRGIISFLFRPIYFFIMFCYSNDDIDFSYPWENFSGCEYLEIEDLAFNLNIRLFPNPFTNRLEIQAEIKQYEIKLFDIQGNLMHSEFVNGSCSLDLGHLKNGLYLATIFENGRVFKNVKLLKQ